MYVLMHPRCRAPVTCAADGCTNPKKYSDPHTKLPLCSLECYKKCRSPNSFVLSQLHQQPLPSLETTTRTAATH